MYYTLYSTEVSKIFLSYFYKITFIIIRGKANTHSERQFNEDI